jgi:hypothetical protein
MMTVLSSIGSTVNYLVGTPVLAWKLTFLAVGFALWLLSFRLLALILRRQDLLLDKAAVSLTDDPHAYLSAIERAAKLAPREQHFPWWFRPVPLHARQEAIRRRIRSEVQAVQPI